MNHKMFLLVDEARATRQYICNNTQEKRTRKSKHIRPIAFAISEREKGCQENALSSKKRRKKKKKRLGSCFFVFTSIIFSFCFTFFLIKIIEEIIIKEIYLDKKIEK